MRIVEEGNAVDEVVQRELVASQVHEVVVTSHRARHKWRNDVSELNLSPGWQS